MLNLRAVIGLCLAMSLAGCGALGTSDNTVGPGGPTGPSSTTPTTGDNQFALFATAYTEAYKAQNTSYLAGVESTASDQTRYRLMASAGFSLVRANCSEFFRTRGESQKWFKLASDLVAVGGAVATGIMAAFGSTPVAVSIAALSTATAYSAIDVYSKNFLFGAENIESVRALTMKALADNANAYLTATDWDFGYAATAVMSNQELCKPASILALTREAIKGGTVTSVQSAGTATTQLDGALKQMIAEAAGMSRTLVPTDSQIVGLCWAADPGQFGAEDKTTIANLTAGLKFGPSTGSWSFVRDAVASQCGRLSLATRTAIQKQVESLRPKAGEGPMPAAGMMAPARSVSLPSGGASTGGGTQRNITTFAR